MHMNETNEINEIFFDQAPILKHNFLVETLGGTPPPKGDPVFELKKLPDTLKYAYLDEKNICPVIIYDNLSEPPSLSPTSSRPCSIHLAPLVVFHAAPTRQRATNPNHLCLHSQPPTNPRQAFHSHSSSTSSLRTSAHAPATPSSRSSSSSPQWYVSIVSTFQTIFPLFWTLICIIWMELVRTDVVFSRFAMVLFLCRNKSSRNELKLHRDYFWNLSKILAKESRLGAHRPAGRSLRASGLWVAPSGWFLCEYFLYIAKVFSVNF